MLIYLRFFHLYFAVGCQEEPPRPAGPDLQQHRQGQRSHQAHHPSPLKRRKKMGKTKKVAAKPNPPAPNQPPVMAANHRAILRTAEERASHQEARTATQNQASERHRPKTSLRWFRSPSRQKAGRLLRPPLSQTPSLPPSPPRRSTAGAAPTTTGGNHSSNSRISVSRGNLSLEVNHHESAAHAIKSSLPPSLQSSMTGVLKPESLGGHHGLLPPGYASYASLLAGHHSAEASAAAAAAAHHPSLAHSALSQLSAAHHHKHGISPYVRYTTVKTATGATTLMPVCSDPYCTHCKLTLSSAQLTPTGASASACAAGCTQCTHDKSPLPPTSLAGLSAGLHGLPGLPPTSSATSGLPGLPGLSGLYPPFGVLPGHHGLPYICNWVAGSDYCGKRFGTSEELLQHSRSHTSSSEAASAAAAAAAASGLPAGFPYSSLGLSASALAAVGGGHTPGSLSPNPALRQAYPRSLSPNTLLAAARYHPYTKSPLSASALPTPPTPGASGLPEGTAGDVSKGPGIRAMASHLLTILRAIGFVSGILELKSHYSRLRIRCPSKSSISTLCSCTKWTSFLPPLSSLSSHLSPLSPSLSLPRSLFSLSLSLSLSLALSHALLHSCTLSPSLSPSLSLALSPSLSLLRSLPRSLSLRNHPTPKVKLFLTKPPSTKRIPN